MIDEKRLYKEIQKSTDDQLKWMIFGRLIEDDNDKLIRDMALIEMSNRRNKKLDLILNS